MNPNNMQMLPIDQPSCSYVNTQDITEEQLKKKAKLIKESSTTNKEGSLKKKLTAIKNRLIEAQDINNADIKLITQPITQTLIENRQAQLRQDTHIKTLKPWQQDILNILTPTNYDNRTIHVLLDKKGGIGKTTLKKHCEQFTNFLTITGASKTNLNKAYKKLSENLTQTFWNIIIDLPRSINYLPAFIEEIKDNQFPSWNNYVTPLKIGNNNIFIFLNNEQLLKHLSQDRLKTYIVNKSDKLELINITHKHNYISLNKTKRNPTSLYCNSICQMCKKCHKCIYHNQCICLNKHIRKQPCKICKKYCNNLICNTCKNPPPMISSKESLCRYCNNYVNCEKMLNHIIALHIMHLQSPLFQFDMCM